MLPSTPSMSTSALPPAPIEVSPRTLNDAERDGLLSEKGDVQARQLALKRARQIAVRAVADHPAVDLIHGSDQIAPLHRTVAHDHHFVERRGVLFQTDVERRAAGRGDLLPGIAQKRHFERTAGGDREREASVDIGRRTDGAALDEHRGADDGFAGRIGHRTRDGLFRRRSRGGVRGRLRLPAQHDMFSFERETDRRALEDTSEHRLHGFVVRGYRDAEIDLFAAVYEQVVGLPFDFVENLPDGSFFSCRASPERSGRRPHLSATRKPHRYTGFWSGARIFFSSGCRHWRFYSYFCRIKD